MTPPPKPAPVTSAPAAFSDIPGYGGDDAAPPAPAQSPQQNGHAEENALLRELAESLAAPAVAPVVVAPVGESKADWAARTASRMATAWDAEHGELEVGHFDGARAFDPRDIPVVPVPRWRQLAPIVLAVVGVAVVLWILLLQLNTPSSGLTVPPPVPVGGRPLVQ